MDPLSLETERALILAAQKKDKAAFGQLFKAHYTRVHRATYTVLRDETDAQEATQLTWIKVWDNLPRFNFQSAFTTWLHRIAVNTAIDQTRRKNRYWHRIKTIFAPTGAPETNTQNQETTLPPDTHTPNQALQHRETGQQIAAAIAQLPEPQREVFTLREIEHLTYEAIAHTLQINIGTVMSRLHLARKKLQSHLTKDPS